MAKIAYPEGPLERDHLRDALRRRGKDSTEAFAAAIRERWGHSPLRSYRLALELSLEQVCAQVNRLCDTFAGEPGFFDHSTLSRLEHWPARSRRPTVSHLTALARAYGTSPRALIAPSDWDRFPPADRFTLNALDRLLDRSVATTETPAGVGMMEATRPQAGTAPRTTGIPRTPWDMPGATRSGNPIERDVLMTGEESTQYAENSGNIGDTTLDQLRAGVAEQAGRFANVDRLALFGTVRLLRDRIFAYLDGGQPIRQRRDLYFLAGAACGMLATVSDDLGYPTAAMSHARAGHVFAMEAGDPALTAWLYVMQANVCYWNAQPGKARDYARRGAVLSPAGTVGVWLPSLEARACGELGDSETVRTAVRRAAEIREVVQPGTLDQFGGWMSFNQPKQHFYAAGAFLGTGDDPAVISQTRAAMEAYQNGPVEEFNHSDATIIRFHAAIAHVRSGDMDAATESARVALQVKPEHRTTHVDKSARRLHRQLRSTGVRNSPLAVETRDQIEDFLSTTPARPALP